MLSAYGLSIVETDLSVQKLALPGSFIVAFKNRYDDMIKSMQTVAVVVQKPGNLSDPPQLRRVKDLARAFETASYAYGSDSTSFWLSHFEDFETFYGGFEEGEVCAEEMTDEASGDSLQLLGHPVLPSVF